MGQQPLTVEQLLQGLPLLRSTGDLSRPVIGVTQDSREVSKGVLFVALRGERFDGNRFATPAAAAGAPAVVSDQAAPSTLPGNTAWITVADTRQALAALARRCHREPDTALDLVGVTGTNGKTTTVYLVHRMLQAAGFRCGLIGGVEILVGNQRERASLTTPEADRFFALLARMRDAGCTHCVMEVSSHALERRRVAGARFRSAAFSNLSRDHLDYHRNMEQYYGAKKELFRNLRGEDGAAVVNIDDPSGARLAGELEGTVLGCGAGNTADFQASSITVDWSGTDLEITGPALHRPLTLHSPLIGRTNAVNLLLAAAVCLEMGAPPEAVAAGAAAFAGVPGRFQVITAPRGYRVVVDYAHTDDALRHLLHSMRELTGHGRLITLFGCGGDRDPGKRPLMGSTAAGLSDQVVLTSDNPRTEDPLAIIAQVEAGVRQGAGPETGVTVEPDRREAIGIALGLARPGDTVVVAGKGHEDYQILGSETIHFDDREVVRELIDEKGVTLTAYQTPLELTLADCTRVMDGELVSGQPGDRVSRYSIDSRTIRGGELFFAIVGPNHDAHRFLDAAATADARALVVSRLPEELPDRAVIRVPDTTCALQDLATHVRCLVSPLTVVGITGSCGKTSAKEISTALLASHGPVLSSLGNLNNHYGLPLTLLRLGPGHRRVVCEMGISTPEEMPRLVEIARPDVGVVLNVNPVHLENFDSLESIAAEKGKLVYGLRAGGTAVLNADDPLVAGMTPPAGCRTVTFGVERPADVAAGEVELLGLGGVRFTLLLDGIAVGRWLSPLPGRHNLSNLLAGLAVLHSLGFDPREAEEAVSGLRPYDMRGTVTRLGGGITLYDDSYNANPQAMATVLEMLGHSETPGRRVAALGDMLELGPGAAEAHRKVGRLTAQTGFGMLAAVGALASDVAAGARDGGMNDDAIHTFETADAAGRFLAAALKSGDLLLVKGSRGVGMEAVVRLVTGSRPEDERTD